jgi:hypothetical protein
MPALSEKLAKLKKAAEKKKAGKETAEEKKPAAAPAPERKEAPRPAAPRAAAPRAGEPPPEPEKPKRANAAAKTPPEPMELPPVEEKPQPPKEIVTPPKIDPQKAEKLGKDIVKMVMSDPRMMKDYRLVAKVVIAARLRISEVETKNKSVKEIVEEEIKRVTG